MKKYLLLLSIAFLCMFTTHAQIKKGATFIGGSISGNTQKTEQTDGTIYKSNGINISPVFGKAIKENLILGGRAWVLSQNNDDNYIRDRKFRAYGAGVFLRKYKPLGTSGFSIFAEATFGFTFQKTEMESDITIPTNDLTKRYSVGVSAYPGISYAVSKRLQLETGFNSNFFSLSYFKEDRFLDHSSDRFSKTNGIDFYSSAEYFTSLYLGFRVLLN